jgi:hypothetical protein
MCMSVRTSACTFWTASYPSAVVATPSDAAAGSFVFLPRGRVHRFWAVGRPARLLLIAVPSGIEDYLHEIKTASTDDERHRIGERYGIRAVPE